MFAATGVGVVGSGVTGAVTTGAVGAGSVTGGVIAGDGLAVVSAAVMVGSGAGVVTALEPVDRVASPSANAATGYSAVTAVVAKTNTLRIIFFIAVASCLSYSRLMLVILAAGVHSEPVHPLWDRPRAGFTYYLLVSNRKSKLR